MYRRLAGAYFTMANMAKDLADAAEWIAEHELGNKRPSTEAAAFEARSDAHEPEQRDGRDAQPSADATDAEQRQKDKRLARRRRQSERLAAERQTRTATQAAPVAAVDGEDAMDIAGCDEEAEQAAAPLVELHGSGSGGRLRRRCEPSNGGRNGRRRLRVDGASGGRSAGGG